MELEQRAKRDCRGARRCSACWSGCREQPVPVGGGSSGVCCSSWDITSRTDGCALGLDYH